jgi:tetratricopeptide (TPR) repeat protein
MMAERIAKPRRWRSIVVVAAIVLPLMAAGGYAVRERQRTERLFEEGSRLLADREYSQAREQFERYLLHRPADSRARLLAARACRQSKAFRDAREHLKRYRDESGDVETAAIEDNLIRVQTGDEAPLPDLRERARQDDELALVILEVLVQHDLDTYQLGLALDGFTRYLLQRPEDLHALLGRGFVWERFLNFGDAAEDYRRAVESHPENRRARLKLAETLLIAGTPDEAQIHFEWLVSNGAEQSPPVRLGLARCNRKQARPEEAIAILDRLLTDFPTQGEAVWERGELELEQGRASQAEQFLRKAVILRPFDRRIHYAMSRCLLRLERPAEAEKHAAIVKELDADLARLTVIRSELAKRPVDAALRCEGGSIFLKHGEREEGIRWLQLALKLDPKCARARSALREAGQNPD